MAKVIDNHREKSVNIERDNAIRKNRDNKVKQAERERTTTVFVPVVLVIGVGAGLYGYRLGRKGGYLDGVNAGYVKGGQELIASWREHSEQMRLSRGE